MPMWHSFIQRQVPDAFKTQKEVDEGLGGRKVIYNESAQKAPRARSGAVCGQFTGLKEDND